MKGLWEQTAAAFHALAAIYTCVHVRVFICCVCRSNEAAVLWLAKSK